MVTNLFLFQMDGVQAAVVTLGSFSLTLVEGSESNTPLTNT